MSIGEGRTISIVGAGIAGLTAACSLARLGFRINIYERGRDPRTSGAADPGSCVLTNRSMQALESIGIADDVRRAGLSIRSQILHHTGLSSLRRRAASVDRLDAQGLAISFDVLRSLLRKASEKFDNIEIFFGQTCDEADAQAGTLSFVNDPSSSRPTDARIPAFTAGSLIIGADGPQSVVRRAMQFVPGFAFSQRYAPTVLRRTQTRQEAASISSSLDPGATHVWARCGVVVTAVPRAVGGFDCSIHGPARGPMGLETIRSRPAAEAFLNMHARELFALDPSLADALAEAPIRPVLTTRCQSWGNLTTSGASLMLVGDAAHAGDGLFGLDTGAAIEDGVALGDSVERAGGDPAAALDRYQEQRCHAADAGADTLERVMESLTSKSESRFAYARTLLERSLADMLPSLLAPPAGVLAAPDVPLEQAARRADRLQRVLRGMAVLGFILLLFVLVLLRVPAWPLLVVVIIAGWITWEATRDRAVTRSATR